MQPSPSGTNPFRTVRLHGVFKNFQVLQIVEWIQEQFVEPINVLGHPVTCAAPSQQLPSIIKVVTTGVNLDNTGLVNHHYPTTVVEAYTPQVVGSVPPLREFEQ